jgi:DNA-binding NarL/FixJ family response regulator
MSLPGNAAAVVICDSRPLVAGVLADVLVRADIEACAADGFESALTITEQLGARVVLASAALLNPQVGYWAAVTRARKRGACLVVWVDGEVDADEVVEATNAGVAGFLSSRADAAIVLRVLRTVLEGERALCPVAEHVIATRMLLGQQRELAVVTVREREVLELVASGVKETAIADHLLISRNAVSTHKKALLAKLGAANSAALIDRAYQHGLLVVR